MPWPTAGSEDALAVSCTRQGRGKRRRAEHGHAVKQRESLPVTIEAESGCTPRNLGPLVLVNPILERMGIRRLVDLHCPADPRLQIPTGVKFRNKNVARRLTDLLHVLPYFGVRSNPPALWHGVCRLGRPRRSPPVSRNRAGAGARRLLRDGVSPLHPLCPPSAALAPGVALAPLAA